MKRQVSEGLYGITHDVPMKLLWLWRWLFCKRGWHLFDEVLSLNDHCLYCDACQLTVNIASIEHDREGQKDE